MPDDVDVILKTLARGLDRAIEASGCSVVWLASDSGVSRQTIHRMLKGEGPSPNLDRVARLARSLKQDPIAILTGTVPITLDRFSRELDEAPVPAAATPASEAEDAEALRSLAADPNLAPIVELIGRLAVRVRALEDARAVPKRATG